MPDLQKTEQRCFVAPVWTALRVRSSVLLRAQRGAYREARMALDERSHVRVVGPREQVAFPMAWNGTVLDFGGTFADGDRIDDLSRQPAWRSATFRIAHAPPCPKMPDQLFLEHAAGLDK